MKIVTTLLLFSISYVLTSQCPVGRVELRTQADVDRFGLDWPNCQEINGSVEIGYPKVYSFQQGGFACTMESDITNLRGLQNIKRITRDLIINCVPDLGSLRGLDNLEVVERVFDIELMPGLTDFKGLERFKAQNGNFFINAPNLASFEGLDSFKKAVNFAVYSENLLIFSGLKSLYEVFRFNFGGSTLFEKFDSLQVVSSFGFSGNDTIEYFNYLERFRMAELDGLSMGNNPKLKKVSLPKSLTRVNNLYLTYLPSMVGLNDFDGITEVEVLLLISLPRLKNLSGLENLKIADRRIINDGIIIGEMDSLLSLDGIGLEEVKSRITLRENPVLQDISAIEGINFSNSGDPTAVVLRIKDNPNLSNCVNETICDLAKNAPHSLDISGNGPGCSSITEILEACAMVSTEDVSDTPQASISLYPNPAHDWVMIRGVADLYSVRLLDMMGRQLRHSSSDRMDLTELDAGMYVVQIERADGSRLTKKLIKK
jgi:hypothetical protein